MGRCLIYYVGELKKPEEWVLLSEELKSMDIWPIQLYGPKDIAKVLKKLCMEKGSAVVVNLPGGFYAVPNGQIQESGNGKGPGDVKLTTVKDMIAKRLKGRVEEIIITSEKGFENFAKDLFEGRIKISPPWWKKVLMILAAVVAIVALLVHFGIELPELSGTQRIALKVLALLLILFEGWRRGYRK
ncbi:hypothetical protein [Thermococcus pacificus]|uniref:Uncharacterized protein n=1 Tax=Thermococcus pacificus TaxID=71998 RepID=A0A218P8V3_9EURY|nr:hypothetical protein [Thermococcus pacificus]ASJ07204.1 hypothetical protein A3L08_07665 [Thermococcus pacificus]